MAQSHCGWGYSLAVDWLPPKPEALGSPQHHPVSRWIIEYTDE